MEFNIIYKIQKFFTKLKRVWDFAVIGWGNYDWDHGYLYELILFKLKRMDYALKNGVAIHEKPTLQSLRICIKLLEKINKPDSYHYFTDLHDAKWGVAVMTPGRKTKHGTIITFERAKVITEEDKEIETREFLEAYRKDEEQETRDIKLLFDIMAKYSRAWWD